MVPLDDRRTVLDWMSVLRIPIILVAGTYVGTMSHTLTSLEVLVRRNLDIAAVVVSESEGSAASLEETVATVSDLRIDRRGGNSAACARGRRSSGLRAACRADVIRISARYAPDAWV